MGNFIKQIPLRRQVGNGTVQTVGWITDKKQGAKTIPTEGVFTTPTAYTREYAYYETTTDMFCRDQNGNIRYLLSRDPSIYNACMETYGTDALGLAGRLLQQVRIACANNYYDNSLSLGVDIAEMGSTIGMISSTMSKIAAAYKALRKGKVKEAVHDILGYPKDRLTPRQSRTIPHSLRGVRSDRHTSSVGRRMRKGSLTAANAWLEVTYGWTPLIGMVYDWAGTVQNGLSSPQCAGRVRKQISQAFPVYSKRSTYWTSLWYEEHRGAVEAKAGITLRYRVVNPTVVKLDHLGLADPAVVAWELVPYSFVVDWFLPVGDTLRALNAYKGLAISGTGFVKAEYTLSTQNWHEQFRNGEVLTQRSEGIATGALFRRHINEIGRPDVSWALFAPKLGVKRLTSAISLLIQSFIRGK